MRNFPGNFKRNFRKLKNHGDIWNLDFFFGELEKTREIWDKRLNFFFWKLIKFPGKFENPATLSKILDSSINLNLKSPWIQKKMEKSNNIETSYGFEKASTFLHSPCLLNFHAVVIDEKLKYFWDFLCCFQHDFCIRNVNDILFHPHTNFWLLIGRKGWEQRLPPFLSAISWLLHFNWTKVFNLIDNVFTTRDNFKNQRKKFTKKKRAKFLTKSIWVLNLMMAIFGVDERDEIRGGVKLGLPDFF